MVTTDKYVFFWKSKLGQWNMTPFKDMDGIVYNCAEQFMMAKKAELFGDHEAHKNIMASKKAKDQQTYGRFVKNFNQEVWDNNARDIVYLANWYKFTQNPELWEILKNTGNKILVEASPFDKIWGIALSEDTDIAILEDESNWNGLNWLGETLVKVRDDIKLALTSC
jgi:ribA/ribD-fused uncharacterized protein